MKELNGYTLANEEKIDRAINGSIGSEGRLVGGIGSKATDEELIAEYDRLGGLIQKDGNKVKTGSFYDFEKKQPRKEPEVSFITEIEGELVETSEDEAKALKTAKKKLESLKAKKKNVKK